MNRNAHAGRNVERLIENSIVDQPAVILALKKCFKIKGELKNSAGGGIYGDKSDMRINFDCGHYVDANIKSYKGVGFNQLTRTTISGFCNQFNLDASSQNELEFFVVEKSKNTQGALFPLTAQEKWGNFFNANAKRIVKWGFSSNTNREVLILYNKNTSQVKIYPMKKIVNNITAEIAFTKGGVNIGRCISFQRKGGNGKASRHIPKVAIEHPGNNIQLKLKIKKLIEEFENKELAEYTI
ncbi:MAG: hypothetical protein FWG63_05230 [Defluviitaleaceae bacterium]|nr:hypothetical protein [Defluviitaleaceae bacterium]